MAAHDPFPMEALLAEAGWLSALARRLVGDPSAADDVVQDTFLAALTAPPRKDKPLRPWLASAARNVARMRRRSETARKAREASSIDTPESLSADDLAEKLESQRLLVDALGQLDEPYRSTLLLHYFEHIDSAEIAKRQGIAAGTVRWRIKVGVDSLRARLDERHHGDRDAWCALLMPLATPALNSAAKQAAAASPGLFAGVLGMNLGLKLGIGLALACAIVFGVRLVPAWIPNEESSFSRASTGPAMQEQVAVEPRPLEPSLAEPTGVARTPIRSTPAELAVPATSTRVEARILDASGGPIADVMLATENLEHGAAASSDASGRVTVDFRLPFESGSVSFHAAAPGRATRFVSVDVARGKSTYLGDLVLGPGGAISGSVVDQDEQPIAGAIVAFDALDTPQSELDRRIETVWRSHGEPSTTSRTDGSFVLSGVAVGLTRVVATTREHLPTFSEIIEVRAAQESAGVQLKLVPIPLDRLLAVLVLDPDGKPMPYADVGYESKSPLGSESGSFLVGVDGRYRRLVRPGSKFDLRSYSLFGATERLGVDPKDGEVVLRFAPAHRVELLVTDERGSPIENYSLWVRDANRVGGMNQNVGSKHSGGLVNVLAPANEFRVQVHAQGYVTGDAGPFDVSNCGDRMTIVLVRAAAVRGHVLAGGAPCPAAKVSLFREWKYRIQRDGFRVFRDCTSADETKSVSDGSFELTLRESDRVWVRAEREGLAPCEIGPLEADAKHGLDGLELRLSHGGTLEGHVLVPNGREAAGTVVAISRGDGFPRSQRVGPDGAFRFERLMPGAWLVKEVGEELGSGGGTMIMEDGHWDEIPSNCVVEEGRVTRFDLDLGSSRAACKLHGRLTVDGTAPGAWRAELLRHEGQHIRSHGPNESLTSDGSFHLESEALGEHTFTLMCLGGELDGLRLTADLVLVAGEMRWEADLRTARLHVDGSRGSHADGDLAWIVVGANGEIESRSVPSGNEPIDLVVPSGAGRLVRHTQDVQGPDPSKWPALVEKMLAPGSTQSVTLP